MNRYFERNSQFDSNSRIFKAYYGSSEPVRETLFGTLTKRVFGAMQAIRNRINFRAVHMAKVVTFSALVLGVVGVAGAIEFGVLSVGAGLLVSAGLLGTQFLLLHRHRA